MLTKKESKIATDRILELLKKYNASQSEEYYLIPTIYGPLRLRLDVIPSSVCYTVFGRFLDDSKVSSEFRKLNPRVNQYSLKFNFHSAGLNHLLHQIDTELSEITPEN